MKNIFSKIYECIKIFLQFMINNLSINFFIVMHKNISKISDANQFIIGEFGHSARDIRQETAENQNSLPS